MIQIDKVTFDNLIDLNSLTLSVASYDRDIPCGRVWIQVGFSTDETIFNTQYLETKEGLFEGEAITVFYDSADEVHKFIEENYEITD